MGWYGIRLYGEGERDVRDGEKERKIKDRARWRGMVIGSERTREENGGRENTALTE